MIRHRLLDELEAGPTALGVLTSRSSVDRGVLADQSREPLGTAVRHEVIAEAVRRDGIVVPPDEVDAQVAAAGGARAAADSGHDLATAPAAPTLEAEP